MVYRNYEYLPASGRDCYDQIVRWIESYSTEWTFSQLEFKYVFDVYGAVLNDHPEYFWLQKKQTASRKVAEILFL